MIINKLIKKFFFYFRKQIYEMKNYDNYLMLILALILFSCGDSNDNTIITTANISGSVILFDEGITQVENTGMTISVEGSSISTSTNANGNYTLTNVPFGNTTLIFEKNGFGTFKKFDIDHNNGDTFITENPSLGQKSSTTITNLTVSLNGNDVTIAATTNPAGSINNTRYIRYFFSLQSSVSNTNYDSVLETIQSQINPYNLNLSVSALSALGFSSGQTIYVRAYGESFWSNQYNDPNSSTTIFPNLNLNTSAAVSFVMP